MNTPARGHHYISQCYLKRFTRNGGKNSPLWVCDLNTGKTFSTVPGNVAKIRDFNAIEGMAPDELERQLAKFETEANKALDKIESDRSLQDQQAWIDVINLAAMFNVRNPEMRENMRQFQEQVARKIMDLVLHSKERWESQRERMARAKGEPVDTSVTYEEAKEFHERGEYTVEVSNATHIGHELKMLNVVIRAMAARKWSLFIAPKGSGGFITSDNPVMLFHDDGTPNILARPVGHGVKGTTLLFPVTRDLLAVGEFEKGGALLEIEPEHVAHFNGHIVHRAHQRIFAADDRFKFEDWTANNRVLYGADAPAYMQALRARAKAEQDARAARKAASKAV